LSNFGVFASPERRLVFDLNDFDETLPGPWEWDVKRLAASFAVAGRENGFSTGDRRAVVTEAVGSYRRARRDFAGMRTLDGWYARAEVDELLADMRSQMKKSMVRRTEQTLGKARTRDSMAAFSKLTEIVDGEPRIAADPPLIVPLRDVVARGDIAIAPEELVEGLHDLVRRFRETLQNDRRILLEQFRLVDLAHKVVGVGSVGTRAWIALMVGRDQ